MFRFNPTNQCCCKPESVCWSQCSENSFSAEWKVSMPTLPTSLPFGLPCCSELAGDWYFSEWQESESGECSSVFYIDQSEMPCDQFPELHLRLRRLDPNYILIEFEAVKLSTANLVWQAYVLSQDPMDCSITRSLFGSCGAAITAGPI